jgi:hypothetical protein
MLVGKPEGKRLFTYLGVYETIVFKWILRKSKGGEDNIKMDLKKIEGDCEPESAG